MSVKRIIVVGVAVIALAGFITLGIADAVKRNDQLEFQKVELKSKTIEIQQLNNKYKKLDEDLKKAQEDKSTSEEEINKLKEQEQQYLKEKQELEAQLQAKIENKNKLAAASTRVVNAATNTQSASASSGGSLKAIVTNAAIKNGLDPEWFWNLAKCESTWNPNAVNYGYYENGYPSGLFQHISGYWPARAAAHGYAGASVFDAEANANVTASMWRTGSHLWECK